MHNNAYNNNNAINDNDNNNNNTNNNNNAFIPGVHGTYGEIHRIQYQSKIKHWKVNKKSSSFRYPGMEVDLHVRNILDTM